MPSERAQLLKQLEDGAIRRLVVYATLSLIAEDVAPDRQLVTGQLELMRSLREQLTDPDAEAFASKTIRQAVWQTRDGELDELIAQITADPDAYADPEDSL